MKADGGSLSYGLLVFFFFLLGFFCISFFSLDQSPVQAGPDQV
jgi:hypothetical protein